MHAGRSGFFWIFPLISLAFSTGSSAQETVTLASGGYGEETMLFQEIPSVVGASKYEQKVTEAPSSVSIITSEDIKIYGYRTLADILRSVRSFYITYDRNYSYVGVRGFGRPSDYNSRILLLIDGHRVNEDVYNQALVGTEGVIDVDLMDRVEVIRGPGSSLYGSNAFFAVVNVITKRGRDLKGGEASGEAGSFQTYKGRLTYGDRFQNGLEAILSGTAYESKGDTLYFREFDPAFSTDPRAANGGVTKNTDYDRYQSLFLKNSYKDITLEAAAVTRTKGIPTGAFGTDFNDPGNKTVDKHTFVDLKYEHAVASRTDLSVRLYYDWMWYEGDYLYLTDPLVNSVNKDWARGDWWGSEIRAVHQFSQANRLIAGAEYEGDLKQDQGTYYTDGSFSWEDRRRARLWAIYAQDEVSLSRSVVLNAGVRYDHYSTFGGTTNPRVALILNPAQKSVVKLLYGSAFRAPNAYELYYESPGTNVANPELKPEKIKTWEAVYEQYLGDTFRLSASLYYYKITNLIDQVDTGSGSMFQNLDQVTAKGAELEFDNRWSGGAEAKFSYTIQRAEDKMTGEPLVNSPAQLAKLNLSVPVVKERVFVALEEQYTSRSRTVGGSYAPGYYLTNLTLFSRNVINRLELSASIYNLTDKKYADPVSVDLAPLDTVTQDGRTFRVKLTYAF